MMEGGSNIIRLQGCQEKDAYTVYEVDLTAPVLGEGNMGVVRQGVMIDNRTGKKRPVAIKFLFEDLGKGAIRRSEREASIRIIHENLVEMIDFLIIEDGRGQRHYHVVSELLHGVMLLDIIKNEVEQEVYDKFPKIKEMLDYSMSSRVHFAISVVKSVLSGILTLHDNGYIHRDIDPSNIMITDSGKVKLIDLGIAKLMGSEDAGDNLTLTGDFIGKPAYAAPELVRGDIAHQGKTTDIYAIGIMLYQMITGSLPFTGSINDVLKKQLNEKLPLKNIKNSELRKVIKKATEKDQLKRYQSASEMRVDLEKISNSDIDPATNSNLIPIHNLYVQIIIIIICGVLIGALAALI